MSLESLRISQQPRLCDGSLVIGFSGWMDGGEVSTGTIQWLVDSLGADPVAEIPPEGYYIYNFPGTMDVSAMFRPHIRIHDGLVETFEPPSNTFYHDQTNDLLLFNGKEPNLNWESFADALIAFAVNSGVTSVFFIGSFAGMVPHTRDPRLTGSVSDEALKSILAQHGFGFTNYEGPGSFASFMMTRAGQRGLRMASLVAEIPPYIQGANPRCIDAVARKLCAVLRIQADFQSLRSLGDEWERRVDEVLAEKGDLSEYIEKLEEGYDHEVFNTQMSDLKHFLQQRGIRLD